MSHKKNKSKNIRSGTIVQTNDRNFYSGRNYAGKPNEDPKKKNRPTVVVGSNRRDELALVKITHSQKGKKLKDGFRGHKNSRVRPIIETKDNQGQPIRIGSKFEINKKHSLSKQDFRTVLIETFVKSKYINENKNRIRKIKGRKVIRRKKKRE